jgi:DNA-binding XRE family transcriptional regulator
LVSGRTATCRWSDLLVHNSLKPEILATACSTKHKILRVLSELLRKNCTRYDMHPPSFVAAPLNSRSSATPAPPPKVSSVSWLSAERASSTYITDRFGIRLRTLRKARRMTQIEMSIEFGIDRSFISDVERGKKAISLPLLEVIAIGFGLTMSDLLTDI